MARFEYGSTKLIMTLITIIVRFSSNPSEAFVMSSLGNDVDFHVEILLNFSTVEHIQYNVIT